MQFPRFDHPVTGLVVPVSALRSRDSVGIGEFADLVHLGRWAASVGLNLIQVLPVNDTGYERSPYSALSAFALHPVHARLQDFPEAAGNAEIATEIGALRERLSGGERIDFPGVLEGKLALLRKLWKTASSPDLKASEAWAGKNPWAKSYALFSLLREADGLKSWTDWSEYRDPSPKDLSRLWKKHRKTAGFWIWMQWRLEEQFRTAAESLDALGIALKGDIPILINDDSADVWAERKNFHLDFRAGAPPDALAPGGQNWGFPTYDWQHLRKNDFGWWRARLDQAAKFYHAYRIDHVLGFFRIWAVPEGDVSALNGRYDPAVSITRADLEGLGFDDGRISWLSRAHFPGEEIRNAFGEEAGTVQSMLEQVGLEDLWRAPADGLSEKDVMAAPLSGGAKASLVEGLRNRTLIPTGEDGFQPCLNFRETRGWYSLSDGERAGLEGLVSRAGVASDALWADNARELLAMMKADGKMLVCAEDLGAVPDCVPGVLSELGILGLKVTRWARKWAESEQPYEKFSEYPVLSVTTSSVHDSSTLRGWLKNEAAEDGALRNALGLDADTPLDGPDGVRTVLEALQDGASLVAAYPIQDLLALDASCVPEDLEAERINIPGTVQESNWTWRMNLYLEDLPEKDNLNAAVNKICRRRSGRPASFPGGVS